MAKVVMSANIVYQELDKETVLLDMSSGVYFGLDPVGARIWTLLAEHGDSEAVFAQVLAEYDVDEMTLRTDTERLLADLADAGLILVDSNGAAGV